MERWKWVAVLALIFGAILAKLLVPQFGQPVKTVFFGESQPAISVFGGAVWDE